MADLNSLENLAGPVAAPAPLGQALTSGITPGIVNPGFDQVAQALTRGGGTVNQAIGSGMNQTITGGSGMDAVSGGTASGLASLAGVGPGGNVAGNVAAAEQGEMYIPEAKLQGQDLQNEEFSEAYATGGKRGLRQARRADRKADRKERKDAGLTGAAKWEKRKEQRRNRKDSKWHAKSGA